MIVAPHFTRLRLARPLALPRRCCCAAAGAGDDQDRAGGQPGRHRGLAGARAVGSADRDGILVQGRRQPGSGRQARRRLHDGGLRLTKAPAISTPRRSRQRSERNAVEMSFRASRDEFRGSLQGSEQPQGRRLRSAAACADRAAFRSGAGRAHSRADADRAEARDHEPERNRLAAVVAHRLPESSLRPADQRHAGIGADHHARRSHRLCRPGAGARQSEGRRGRRYRRQALGHAARPGVRRRCRPRRNCATCRWRVRNRSASGSKCSSTCRRRWSRSAASASPRKDPDFIPAFIVNHILGGGSFSSRLYSEVREKRGLAYSVYSYLLPLDATSLFMGGTQTRADKADETVGLIEEEIKRLAENGPTLDELERAKSYIQGSYPLNFDTSTKIAAQLVQLQVDDLGIDYWERRNGLIDAVTLDDVQACRQSSAQWRRAVHRGRPYPAAQRRQAGRLMTTMTCALGPHMAERRPVRLIGAVILDHVRDLGSRILAVDRADQIERRVDRERHAAAGHDRAVLHHSRRLTPRASGARVASSASGDCRLAADRGAPRRRHAAVEQAGRAEDHRAGADRRDLRLPADGAGNRASPDSRSRAASRGRRTRSRTSQARCIGKARLRQDRKPAGQCRPVRPFRRSSRSRSRAARGAPSRSRRRCRRCRSARRRHRPRSRTGPARCDPSSGLPTLR